MQLGRVIGSVWSTVKNQNLEGHRLLLVQPVTADLKPTGRVLICADCVGAGAGELIYWCRGRESSFAFLPKEVPTDATIVAIIDSVDVRSPKEAATALPEPSAPLAVPAGPETFIDPPEPGEPAKPSGRRGRARRPAGVERC